MVGVLGSDLAPALDQRNETLYSAGSPPREYNASVVGESRNKLAYVRNGDPPAQGGLVGREMQTIRKIS